MDKALEILGLIAGGVTLYLIAENNLPSIRKAISNVIPSPSPSPISTPPPVSTYRHISTTIANPWEPIPGKKGACPPGTYEDYTDGVLHRHSAHGTRQLNPNVKPLNPYWQNAWGIKYVDNNYWGYSTTNQNVASIDIS
ncbi:MAG: hypothetical protein WA364_02050 [Candidatus Nitrosopolaris sp.]